MSDIQHNLNVLMRLHRRKEQAMSTLYPDLHVDAYRFTPADVCDSLTSVIEFICADNPQATEDLDQYINHKAREVAQIEARNRRNV